MKQFKSTELIIKTSIADVCFTQLFGYLKLVTDGSVNYQFGHHLDLPGAIAAGNVVLSKPNHQSGKCWFVNEGMAMGFYYDHVKRMSVHTIFGAGEMAILPDHLNTKFDSQSYLVACDGAHLLEICTRDMDKKYKLYPKTESLTRQIITYQCNKPLERDRLMRYKGLKRVLMFCQLFPQINLIGDKNNIYKKFVASFLGFEPSSLSRHLKKMKHLQQKGELENG